MKRKWMIIVMIAVFLATTVMLYACDKGGDNNDSLPKTYNIQYTDDAGLHTITVESGALYSMASIPQRNGYEFLGLYDAKAGGTQYVDEDGNCVSPFKDNCNMVLYPQFKAKEYTLVLNYGEAAVTGMRQMTVSYGQIIAELPMNLSVENKTFVGWYTEQDKGGVQIADQYGVIPQNAIVDENTFDLSDPRGFVNIYAGFKGQEHLVTFYYGDDPTPEEMLIEYGTYITDVVTTRRVDGKAVMTWSKSDGDNAQNDIFTGKVTGPMVLYAYEYAPVIDFDANGGKDVTSIVRKAGAAIDLPIPERKDYTFVGWYTENGTGYSATYMPTNSIKLIAHWNAKLVFNTNGGTAVDDISEPVGTRVQLPTTEKEGYIFAGWYTNNGKEYTATSMPKDSVQLTARYYKSLKMTKVIVNQTSKVGGGYVPQKPDMDGGHDKVDLSDLYDSGVRVIKVTVHYSVQTEEATSANPARTYMSWYTEEVASEAYKIWTYSEAHINEEWISCRQTNTLNLVSPILHICRYRTGGTYFHWYSYWTDYYLDIEYPDTSQLY